MPDFLAFCRSLQKSLKASESAQRLEAFESARREIQEATKSSAAWEELVSQFSRSVIVDMAAQGWEVEASKKVELFSPKLDLSQPDAVKNQVRQWHLLERDAQLREKSVTEFIRKVEHKRLFSNSWHSIFSVIRDGGELAKQLADVANIKDEPKQTEALARIVSPYLQFVEPDAVCQFTGLKLTDMWRYFRHTWVNPYKSLPGRSMMVLIRDSAAPNHPVIGIGALGSSMAQQSQRDQWIGWDSDVFLQNVSANPSQKLYRWLCSSLQRLIKAIYVEDLVARGIVKKDEIRTPGEKAILRLVRESKKAAEQHRRFPHAAHHKASTNTSSGRIAWKNQALTHLFKSKRAKTLATLLSIRMVFQKWGIEKTKKIPAKLFKEALAEREFKHAVRQIVRLVKAEHVGVKMMDIIVCGAIAPYNALLGGKLICSLLCSPEVVEFYQRKYKAQESIIASSIKGKAVVRKPQLVLLATTSLYGVGSSQYNRIKIPLEKMGANPGEFFEYINLGVSKGFGSYHFSQLTLSLLEPLLARSRNGKRVNSIFGEGVNPLMRKIRDGLAIAGLPSDELLKHGNVRVVYGIPLARNFREILLGLESRPQYFVPRKDGAAATEKLAAFWRKRWLLNRIQNPAILEEVAKHTLAYPITHGGRVPLPRSEQPELFDAISPESNRSSLERII